MTDHVYIYALVDPITGEARYVGKAISLQKRLKQHVRNHNHERSHKWNWIKSLKAHGALPVIIELECIATDRWQESEVFWISYLRFIGSRLTNLDGGGIGNKEVSQETREKLRQINTERVYLPEWVERIKEGRRTGKVPVLTEAGRARRIKAITGAVFSEERRRKISLSKIGKPRSAETIEKLRVASSGKSPSQETRDKLSAAMMGSIKSATAISNMKAAQQARAKIKPGDRFGRLVVISRSTMNARKWKCVCDCGNESLPDGGSLRAGTSKSCGCGIPRFKKNWRARAFATKALALIPEQMEV